MANGAMRPPIEGQYPLSWVAWFLLVVTAPVLGPVIALVDAARWLIGRKHWMGLRLYGFGVLYLTAETVGLVALGITWVMAGFGRFRRPLINWAFAIQQTWAGILFAAVRRIFRLRLEVSGEDAIAPGPIVLMVRHASIVDNLLPAVLVSTRHRIRLRYVLKRELLADPCLDVAGNRLPNHFVERGSDNAQAELAAIGELAVGLGPDDGVLIYPEGTRFSKAKQVRALEKLREGDSEIYERAKRLRHVLPPRLGGPLALLERAEGADVVVLAHHGLEGFAHLRDIWSGGLVDATIRVKFWRLARSEIPTKQEDQVVWLFDVWTRLDDWIDEVPGPDIVG